MNPYMVQQLQVFANPGTANITGVAPNGTDSGEASATARLRGRYRKWTACTDGGLFRQYPGTTVEASSPTRVESVLWNLPGATNILFSWVDMDGITIPFYPPTATALVVRDIWIPQQTLKIPPQGSLVVTATGPLTGAGYILVNWIGEYDQDIFTHFGAIGAAALPGA